MTQIRYIKSFLPGLNIGAMDTATRDALPGVAQGHVVFNTDTGSLEIYDGSTWGGVGSGSAVIVVADATARDGLTGLSAGDLVYVQDNDGSGNPAAYAVMGAGATWATATVLNMAGDNFANADLTATGDRIHDMDGNSITIENADQFDIHASAAGFVPRVRGTNGFVQIDVEGASNTTAELHVGTTGGNHVEHLADHTSLMNEGGTGSSDSAQELRFYDDGNNDYVGFVAPSTVAAQTVWTLPDSDGASGESLVTDGSGALSWAAGGGDTNIQTGDLSGQTVDRNHNFGDFEQNWTNLRDFNVDVNGESNVTATSGADVGRLRVNGGTASMEGSDGTAQSTIQAASDEVTVAFDDGTNATEVLLNASGVDLNFAPASDLALDGDAGTAGQVLVSQGPNLPPVWGAGVSNDLNSTVSDQTGGNYGGGAPVAPPAGPDDGDIHIEVYDDVIAYFVATGGAFPAAADVTALLGADTHLLNADLTQAANRTHDMGGFNQTWNNVGTFDLNASSVDIDSSGTAAISGASTAFEATTGQLFLFVNAAGQAMHFEAADGLYEFKNVDNTAPPVAAEGVFIDPTDGRIYRGAVSTQDTNVANSTLTADADRTHDFADFSQTWNNIDGLELFASDQATAFKVTGRDIGAQVTNVLTVDSTVGSWVVTDAQTPDVATLELTENGSTLSFAADTDAAGIEIKTGAVAAEPQVHVQTAAVDAGTATAGQVLTLTGTDGEVEFQTPANTNVANAALTADADRIHDFADFSQTWNDLNDLTFNLRNAGSIFTVDVDNGSTTAQFTMTPLNTQLNSNSLRLFPAEGVLTDTQTLRFYEETANGGDYVAFRAPAAVTTTTEWILPDGDGAPGQVLGTDGSENLQWVAAGVNKHVDTFDASGDWTLNGSVYERTITAATHGNGTNPIVQVESGAAAPFEIVGTTVEINVLGDVTVRVPATPDQRFAGRVVIV